MGWGAPSRNLSGLSRIFFPCHKSCGILHQFLVHDRSPKKNFLRIHQHSEQNFDVEITNKSQQFRCLAKISEKWKKGMRKFPRRFCLRVRVAVWLAGWPRLDCLLPCFLFIQKTDPTKICHPSPVFANAILKAVTRAYFSISQHVSAGVTAFNFLKQDSSNDPT